MSNESSMSLLALENDPRLFLYTSLTAGSSHIITATSRMETILKANKIPFQAIDMATDAQARRLWQRRSGGRKLPGLVKEGFVIGDLNEVEEWNEYGELKQNIGPVPAANAAIPKGGQIGVQIAPPSIGGPSSTSSSSIITPNTSAAASAVKTEVSTTQGFDKSKGVALPGAEEIKARSEAKKTEVLAAPKLETMTSTPEVEKESVELAKEAREESVNNGDEESEKAVEKKERTKVEDEGTDDDGEEEEGEEEDSDEDDEEEDEDKDADDNVKQVASEEKNADEVKKAKLEEQKAEAVKIPVPVENEADKAEEERILGVTEAKGEHDVKADDEEVKQKSQSGSVPPEAQHEDAIVPTKGTEQLEITEEAEDATKEAKKTQEQGVKQAEHASKSVED